MYEPRFESMGSTLLFGVLGYVIAMLYNTNQ